MATSVRLRELAAVGYEAFVRSCGGLDASNGCLLGGFDRLPSRAQQGWMDGVRAVLGDVYREQEALRASQEPVVEPVAPVAPVVPVVPMSKQVGRVSRSKEVKP